MRFFSPVGPRIELMHQAWRRFFEKQPKAKRITAAVQLYKDGKVTISRAAEIADVNFDGMYQVLAKEGLIERGHREHKSAAERAKRSAIRCPKAGKM